MYIIKSLRRRTTRSLLTIVGVMLSIALVVAMLSVGEGIRESTKEILDEVGVEIFVYEKASSPIFGLTTFPDGRNIANSMKENKNIRAAYPMLTERGFFAANETMRKFITENSSKPIGIVLEGHIPELVGKFGGYEFLEGGSMQNKDDPFYNDGRYDGNFTHEIIVNKFLSKKLKIHFGDIIYIGNYMPASNEEYKSWFDNATWFRVCGVADISWEFLEVRAGLIHLSELQYIAGKKNDTINQILIDLYDPAKTNEVKEWIEKKYGLKAYTQEDYINEIKKFTNTFEGFAIMVGIVGIIISLMFTATIVCLSTREREVEIGVLRAIGFSKFSIFKLVIGEVAIICFIGYISGIIFGYLGTIVVDHYIRILGGTYAPEGFHFAVVTPKLILIAGLFTSLIGIVSSLIPAYLITKMSIGETIRGE
ncbi:MAG: FtsX-like permease family protein [Candidatus Thermoplasmatota archaeon]